MYGYGEPRANELGIFPMFVLLGAFYSARKTLLWLFQKGAHPLYGLKACKDHTQAVRPDESGLPGFVCEGTHKTHGTLFKLCNVALIRFRDYSLHFVTKHISKLLPRIVIYILIT